MPDPVDIEVLLRHRPFVRALARRLVRDDARAEDVVQDTYVAALKNPPRRRTLLSIFSWNLIQSSFIGVSLGPLEHPRSHSSRDSEFLFRVHARRCWN